MNQFQAKQAFLAGYLSKVAVNTDPLEGKDSGYVGAKSGNGLDPATGKEVLSKNPSDKVQPKGTFVPLPKSKQDPKLFRQPGSAPQPAPKVINGVPNVKPSKDAAKGAAPEPVTGPKTMQGALPPTMNGPFSK